jgi:ABC-2 type transport system ATP-binding protein
MTAPAAPPGRVGAEGWGATRISVPGGTGLALDAVSLLARPGEVVAVVGGDGAGKTTLLRCLAGAIAPAAGQVRTPGPRCIGYLAAGSGTYPDLTVAENLAFRAAAYGLPAPVTRQRTAELIDRAGLTGAGNRLAGQLSGGMRQKLGVIAALLHEPDLLILDEPTTGVDPVSRAGLWRLIAGAAAAGAAVVLATTYLDEASRTSSVLVLDGGRELAAGTPAEIVAAMPGTIVVPAAQHARPADESRSWRRAGVRRVWVPPGVPQLPGELVTPDLQDAVTVAALAREPHPAAAAPAEPSASVPGTSVLAASVPGTSVVDAPGLDPSGAAGPAAQTRPGADEPLAECDAVTRRFGHFVAVREVTLQVRPGEIVGLLGANGAGKTTLIRMLLGLLHASAGTVALFGGPPSRDTRRRLGYVPQGLGLYDDLTVAENLSFSAAVFGASAPGPVSVPAAAAASQAPAGSASRPPLGPARVPVGRLSLGLQRRAAFAQALAHHPDLLILDEPTSGVDPLGRARLWDTVRSAAEGGAGVLVTTHYMEEARECDRLVIMADGAVVAGGTPAQVIGDATVTVVTADAWKTAFRKLEDCGLSVTLAGHALRVPGADPETVRQALAGGEGPGAVSIHGEPATLEERFFQLVSAGAETAAATGEPRDAGA